MLRLKALLYGHETRLVRYNKETQALSFPSLNYTQGYSHSNLYKSSDFGGSRGGYGCDGGSYQPNSGGSNRGHSGGRFVNFKCQLCLKFGHTTNVYHFRSDMSFQPYESVIFFIQQHYNQFPTPLVLSEPPILGLIPIPSLELLL